MATFDNMGLEENLVEFIISNISHIYQSKYNTTDKNNINTKKKHSIPFTCAIVHYNPITKLSTKRATIDL